MRQERKMTKTKENELVSAETVEVTNNGPSTRVQRILSPEITLRSLAYHEAGHSVAAYVQRCTEPGRVTIGP